MQTIQKGKVLELILHELTLSGYRAYHSILEAKDYGVPQIRKRLFIVGIRSDLDCDYNFPPKIDCEKTLSDILGGVTERDYGYTVRVGGRHSGIDNRFNWDCYMVNGAPKYITPEECLQLQGFPADHYLAGSTSDKYRQVGNSVPTTVVREIGKSLISTGIFNSP